MLNHSLHHIRKINSRGFTLIELVVTIAVTGILSVVAAAIMSIGIDSYNLFTSHAIMQRESQNLIRLMNEHIPMCIPNSIAASNGNHFRFSTTRGQTIRFQHRNAHDLIRFRIIGSPWRTIVNNVTASSFSYQREDGTAWSGGAGHPVEDIKRLTVNFSLSYLGETENYTANFTIRN